MTGDATSIVQHGLLAMSDSAWDQAVRRAAVIAPLAARDVVGYEAVDSAAQTLGISRRQVYVLIDRYRRGTGKVTELLPGQSDGGRGQGRLSPQAEAVIAELIRKRYLKRQQLSLAVVHRDIVRACTKQGIGAPARSTVARRLAALHPSTVARRRGGAEAARPLQSAGGRVPEITAVMEQVQIDHTVIDLIVVDERDRQPIGRPYLTAAIDVYSRCLPGIVVTLEPPSAVSVGLCLAQMTSDKRPRLEGLGIDADWPMSGKPRTLYLDNASEFKSEALRRGCQQHGITLDYRPLGRPHYGGIVERVIGTAIAQVHELPRTTFSNPIERRTYDSDKMAALTLRELERWLALAVIAYHGSVHGGLGQTPAGHWAQGIAASGRPPVITNPTSFLVDFLPVVRRKLGRTGFVIDHVHYFTNVLKPWIARRERMERFVIRRDPRDISRIWVLDPEGSNYVEIPYRTLTNPAVTLWEHRQALARWREQGRRQVDEQDLFRLIGQMRETVLTAQRETRRSRRDRERRKDLHEGSGLTAPEPPKDLAQAEETPVVPFGDIEEW